MIAIFLVYDGYLEEVGHHVDTGKGGHRKISAWYVTILAVDGHATCVCVCVSIILRSAKPVESPAYYIGRACWFI